MVDVISALLWNEVVPMTSEPPAVRQAPRVPTIWLCCLASTTGKHKRTCLWRYFGRSK